MLEEARHLCTLLQSQEALHRVSLAYINLHPRRSSNMPSPENEYVQRGGTRYSKDGEDGRRRTPKGDIASLLNRLRTDDGSVREKVVPHVMVCKS